MSLIVYLLSKDKSFKIDKIESEIQEPQNDLFGFEVCRYKLWGHEIMKLLGCNMLYSLNNADIYAFDEDIDVLKRELHIVLENILLISERTKYECQFIEFRIENALEVIRVAEKYLDKVGVTIG